MDEARRLVAGSAERVGALLAGRGEAARRKPDDRTWSPSGYAWHLADAFRAWAERFWAIGHDPEAAIVPFDQDELARVRGYDDLSPVAAVWALSEAAQQLQSAFGALDAESVFVHPEFGEGTVGDVMRWMAHEAHHHELDISRGLNLGPG